jgi:hypothetical protein
LIRFLSHLFKIPYETCKSCETLKQQLEFERSEKKELLDTIIKIVNPKVTESVPVEINPVMSTSGLFSRRRAALEERDRQEAQTKRESKNIGRPDIEITKLETELEIEKASEAK